MLHGSGPLDRDENTKGQRLDIFNTIADALGQSGIASFRYDKRGCGKSKGEASRPPGSTIWSRMPEPRSTHCWLAARTRRVFLLGHSEGTLAAPVLAARRSGVGGLVLLCPTVAPIETTLWRSGGTAGR